MHANPDKVLLFATNHLESKLEAQPPWHS